MKRALPFMLLLALPAQAIAADDAMRDTTSDVWIESQLVTTYSLNPNLRPFDIDARVKNGTATLSGAVEESTDKELAERIARSVEGVKDVDNDIAVKDDARTTSNSSGRTFPRTVEDATITARVKSKLLWNAQTDGLDINVDTSKGIVTLQGRADSEAAKSLAGRLASRTSGVEEVRNSLVVDPQVRASMSRSDTAQDATAKKDGDTTMGAVDLDKAQQNVTGAVTDVGKTISDTWVSTKVSSSLSFSKGVDADSIDVSVQNGVVTLAGSAASESEKQRAEELAKDVRGVKEVKNNITVPLS